jgi:hypothetical protein
VMEAWSSCGRRSHRPPDPEAAQGEAGMLAQGTPIEDSIGLRRPLSEWACEVFWRRGWSRWRSPEGGGGLGIAVCKGFNSKEGGEEH